jgi:DNA replication protein DnaC
MRDPSRLLDAGVEPKEAVRACPVCLGRGWVLVPQRSGAGAARRCDCRLRLDRSRALEQAGIPPRYCDCRLDNFQVAGDSRDRSVSPILAAARSACQRYVDTFLQPEGDFREAGLVFVGRPGAGKTHLAVAVLRELMALYGVRGRFVDFTTLLHQIQSTFDPSSADSKRSLLDPLQSCDVLVLDELGAQKPTAWVSEILYLVMNARYSRRRPTLFTTNFPLGGPAGHATDGHLPAASFASGEPTLEQRIPARLVSRLYEMATPVSLEGVADFRREIRVHQHRL